MKLKISGTFDGKCGLCKKKNRVFTVGDEETYKAVTICKKCSEKLGPKSISELIEEHGKEDRKAFGVGVKYQGKVSGG